MNNCSMKRLPGLKTLAVAGVAGLLAVGVGATTLPDIFAVAERLNQQAKDLAGQGRCAYRGNP